MIFPLAYRPFIDSMHGLFPFMTDYWLWLLVPLVLAISLVYKTTRVTFLYELPRAMLRMALQIVAVMILLAVALYGIYFAASRIL